MKEWIPGSAAIMGTGQMGSGIAALLCEHGIQTILIGRSDESLNQAQRTIQTSRKARVRRKALCENDASAAADCLTLSTRLEDVSGCDLIIESIVEDLTAKQQLLQAIAKHLKDTAIVATNTSALRVDSMTDCVSHPERFLGIHFMNPPTDVKLVEIVKGAKTSDETIEKAKAFSKHLGKQTVILRDSEGFVVNRLLMLQINEAARIIESGLATPQQVDKAMRLGCGQAMGPVSIADFIGLDTVVAELQTLETAFGPRYRPAGILLTLLKSGDLGRKSGRGLMNVKPAD